MAPKKDTKRQIAIHSPDEETLAKIDRAAAAAGESRSQFFLRAALARAHLPGSFHEGISAALRAKLVKEMGEAAAKVLGF